MAKNKKNLRKELLRLSEERAKNRKLANGSTIEFKEPKLPDLEDAISNAVNDIRGESETSFDSGIWIKGSASWAKHHFSTEA